MARVSATRRVGYAHRHRQAPVVRHDHVSPNWIRIMIVCPSRDQFPHYLPPCYPPSRSAPCPLLGDLMQPHPHSVLQGRVSLRLTLTLTLTSTLTLILPLTLEPSYKPASGHYDGDTVTIVRVQAV